ncbi:energy-coupling factor transporter ATPase [Oenococcus oeni]|uniref:energy-coupling factor transporter ATPase n=1 Tax=Oenococcus oeni TaxID=1247 RepID=UPI0008F94B40|nr:energy-coupling factor transporter ATPase [Oenococcus oeni]OIK86667.1 energy-coupling factor transporter ATPase [Oenococcus oeni]OIL08987.1 energy-coupling factor transporter ATPase [Oenococcus oeni]OIL14061.1 energy-coupling factor transporter ATPase [Oenococcus oeni]OLQ40310.1 energy-coupling factor transporter ATPase [Oenococcus oeni]
MKIIETKNLNYSYTQSSIRSIENVNFSVSDGEWITIVGKNGSGKSTLIRLLDGLLKADSGKIIIDGLTLSEKTLWEIRKKIGIVFQNPDNQFVSGSVIEDVAFGMENYQIPQEEMLVRAQQALKTVGMIDFAEKSPVRLSGGQKQRVAIAGVLAIQPKILILDEAASMLDPDGRDEVWQTIKKLKEQQNLTVISVNHDLNELNLSDRVILLNDGKIAADTKINQLFSDSELLSKNDLKLPFLQQLQKDLRESGINFTQEYNHQRELVNFLWKSISGT